jgi:hypothetical protein
VVGDWSAGFTKREVSFAGYLSAIGGDSIRV